VTDKFKITVEPGAPVPDDRAKRTGCAKLIDTVARAMISWLDREKVFGYRVDSIKRSRF
jgi:hypothetical protein